MQLLGFNFGSRSKNEAEKETKRYVVPDDRAIGRPHMMGWLDLLGDDEELTGGTKKGGDGEKENETFESDNWVAVEE